MPNLAPLFYFARQKCKRFSWFGLALLLLGCSAGAGGIGIDAPVADLEGGTTREATVCDDVAGAPSGSFVRVRNVSDSQVADVDQTLAPDGSFSVAVCVEVGETLEIQIFDAEGEAISDAQTLTREASAAGVCSEPTNTPPDCP